MQLTIQEECLIKMVRDIRPFEIIQVSKDKSGKVNEYFVVRTQKILVGEGVISHLELEMRGKDVL